MVRWSYDMYTYAKGKLEARTKELLALADRKRDTRLGQYTEERDALLKTLQTQQDSIYEQHKDFHQTHFKQLDHNVSKEQEGYSGETEGNPFFREQICSRYDCRAAYVPSLLTTKERCRVDDCTFWSQNCGCGLNHCCSDPYSVGMESILCPDHSLFCYACGKSGCSSCQKTCGKCEVMFCWRCAEYQGEPNPCHFHVSPMITEEMCLCKYNNFVKSSRTPFQLERNSSGTGEPPESSTLLELW